MIAKTLLTLSLAAIAGSAAAAGVYKWTDEDGNVHYGERPPEAETTQTQEVRVVPPPGQAAARAAAAAGQTAAGDAAGTEGESTRSAELERLLREEQCERWSAALAEYRGADFLTIADETTGEHRRMTTEEAAAAIVRAENMVAQNCTDGDDG